MTTTGHLNLLEKLPRGSQESGATGQRFAGYLAGSVAIFCLTACMSTASLMNIIGPGDYLALVVYECFGLIAAGPIASVIIASLAAFRFPVRVIALSSALALLVADLAIGAVISSRGRQLDETALALLPSIPIAVLGLALPFLSARHLLGWQIIFASLHQSPTRQSVSVSGLLIATAIVAVCLTFLRISSEPLVSIALAGGLAGLGFVGLLPMVFLLMRSEYYWLVFGLFCAATFPIGFLVNYFFHEVYHWMGDAWSCIGIGLAATAGMALVGLAMIACRLAGGKLFVATDPEVSSIERTPQPNSVKKPKSLR